MSNISTLFPEIHNPAHLFYPTIYFRKPYIIGISIPITDSPMPTQPPETIEIDTPTLQCNGGGGALGHPRVYLTMKNGQVDCPYCGRHFVLVAGAATAAH